MTVEREYTFVVVEVELMGVRMELPSNTPAMDLREPTGQQRELAIFIGGPEAAAIAYALEGFRPPRPLTHDLLIEVIESLGASLNEVAITKIEDSTFFAELRLSRGMETMTISCRPSDGVAVAVRTQCRIVCAEDVLEAAGKSDDDLDEADEELSESMVEEFKQFIEQVSPEDFES